MNSTFYVLVWVTGLSCLWLFWDQAVKRLLLDLFRERVFELRFDMFRLGMAGKLDYNSEVYRQLETLLCGLLRFSHRVTLLTWFFSKAEQERAKKRKDYEDLSHQVALKISRLQPDVQAELSRILREVSKAIWLYMAFTSLFFLGCFVVAMMAKLVGLWRPDRVQQISGVVEQEAYRAEIKRDRSNGNNVDLSAAAAV
jgi:hypothetical protein